MHVYHTRTIARTRMSAAAAASLSRAHKPLVSNAADCGEHTDGVVCVRLCVLRFPCVLCALADAHARTQQRLVPNAADERGGHAAVHWHRRRHLAQLRLVSLARHRCRAKVSVHPLSTPTPPPTTKSFRYPIRCALSHVFTHVNRNVQKN